MGAAEKQTLEFQAEVRQVLDLVIHSLYSNKEIFLRELISNASDACDKRRFEALNDSALAAEGELAIRVSFDAQANTLTVSDNGIGMRREEAIAHLGTIAKSGTREFFQALTGDRAKDANLIGQFGVGFYSAFIVADRVTVLSRRAGVEPAVRWESSGDGAFTVEEAARETAGTDVTLHLKAEEKEFADVWRLRALISKYSDHIAFPIQLPTEKKGEWETVNRASALWQRPKSDITDEEYRAFYKHIAHDFEEPLAWLHNRVEGRQEYTTLLYLPARAPFDLWDREQRHGLKLYVRRVFIMDDAKHLMPVYLRFVRGVVDSADLPLNVSREILQHNKLIDAIKSASVKRVLDALDKMAEQSPEQYAKFWEQFGRVLKEGPAEDSDNRDRLLKLLRFPSTHALGALTSLADYLGRMKPGQKQIYYVTAESLSAAQASPHLGLFKSKGVEVLLLADRVDEWMMSYVHEFDGKPFQSIAKAGVDLSDLMDSDERAAQEKLAEARKPLLERVQKALGEAVREVRAAKHLTDAPSCVVLEGHDMSLHLKRVLKASGHDTPEARPVLEINLGHPLVAHLEKIVDEGVFSEWARLLLDQALLSEGGELQDASGYVTRVNRLLVDLTGAAPSGRILL
jgi:molecular chaperone HtpG